MAGRILVIIFQLSFLDNHLVHIYISLFFDFFLSLKFIDISMHIINIIISSFLLNTYGMEMNFNAACCVYLISYY